MTEPAELTREELAALVAEQIAKRALTAECFTCRAVYTPDPDRPRRRCPECLRDGVKIADLPPYGDRNNVGRRAARWEPPTAPTVYTSRRTRPPMVDANGDPATPLPTGDLDLE